MQSILGVMGHGPRTPTRQACSPRRRCAQRFALEMPAPPPNAHGAPPAPRSPGARSFRTTRCPTPPGPRPPSGAASQRAPALRLDGSSSPTAPRPAPCRSQRLGLSVASWELGNEPDLWSTAFGLSVSGWQLANDLSALMVRPGLPRAPGCAGRPGPLSPSSHGPSASCSKRRLPPPSRVRRSRSSRRTARRCPSPVPPSRRTTRPSPPSSSRA